MTTRLILVCHAPTAATRAADFPDDEPLDEHGTTQAEANAGALRRVGAVWCGPERRCSQTAAALGVSPVVDPALADLDVGSWRGYGLADLESLDPTALMSWLTEPEAAPHGGESLRGLLDRTAAWLDGLGDDAGRVAAITHPSVIRAIVVNVLGAHAESFWRIDVSPLSQTIVSAHGGRWTLRETGHPLADSRGEP
jgi:broad specificity phosphatase PhoE